MEPLEASHKSLLKELKVIKVVEQTCLPFLLKQTEMNLDTPSAFARLMRALKQANCSNTDTIKTYLNGSLSPKGRETLRILLAKFLTVLPHSDAVFETQLFRCLPVWPRFKPAKDSAFQTHLAAADAVFCTHREMLVPWIRNLSQYITPNVVSIHSETLKKLNLQMLTVSEIWSRIAGDLPTALPSAELQHQHRRLLEKVASYGVKPNSRIAFDGQGVLRHPNGFFDHEDPLFCRAFEQEQGIRFLHPALRDLRAFFINNGLHARVRDRLTCQDFLECLRAVGKQWVPGPVASSYERSASALSAYLEYENPDLRQWPTSAWREISRARIFRVEHEVSDQPSYRRSKMRSVAGNDQFCSLQSATHKSHIQICWSQQQLLADPPCPYILTQIDREGVPALEKVFEHLQFLVSQHADISDYDLSEYLKDVQACYAHLQADSRTKDLPQILSSNIWFNLDSTATEKISKSQLAVNLLPAHVLCLQAPCE